MKLILLMLLLTACGKHEMPREQDLRDSDGDQIINEHEKSGMDKYIASVVPLEEFETEMEFQTGTTSLVTHKLMLSNKTDLLKYTKDLMVKNVEAIHTSDYFSEFSIMRIKGDQKTIQVADGIVRLKLRSPKSKSTPKTVYLVYPDRRVLLAEWSAMMDLDISSTDLNAIISGEAHLAMTHLTEKKNFFPQTQEESIREKTYRVLVNDGIKTNIHYISKEVDLENILKYFNVSKYKNIDEENLLTTTLKPLMAEWWVRRINDRDIIIVKDNLRSLSDHYFEGFAKNNTALSRINGKAQNVFQIKKHKAASVLFKIRGEKKSVSFYEKMSHESENVGVNGYWVCDLYYRKATPVVSTELGKYDILENLRVNGAIPEMDIRSLSDEKGSFLEVEIRSDLSELSVNLESLGQNLYVQEGLYDKNCTKDSKEGPKIKPNLQVPERSLSLTVEAFVEKI